MTHRALAVVILGCLALAAMTRACIPHRAAGAVHARVYAPWVGEPYVTPCDYRRDPWGCHLATLTARALISPTPSATLGPWVTSTPAFPVPTSTPAAATVKDLLTVRLPIMASLTGPGTLCAATWADNSAWWTGGHCLPRNPLTLRVDGAVVTAWQRDAGGRDLAQVVAGSGGPPATLAHLEAGDALSIRLPRGDIPARFAADAWGRLEGGMYSVATWPLDGGHSVGMVCVDGADLIAVGDSGGGVHRAADGAVGGIVVAAEDAPGADAWCGDGQDVVIVRLP